jgi:hypothetical protein
VGRYTNTNGERRVGEKIVRFIVFWEQLLDNKSHLMKTLEMRAKREKFPDRYPKWIFPGHLLNETSANGKSKGFYIAEVDSMEQLASYAMEVDGAWTLKFIPIVEGTKVIEMFQKTQ